MKNINDNFLASIYEDLTQKSSAELFGVTKGMLESFLYTVCAYITHKNMDELTAKSLLYEIETVVKNCSKLGVQLDPALMDAIKTAHTSISTEKKVKPEIEPGTIFDTLR